MPNDLLRTEIAAHPTVLLGGDFSDVRFFHLSMDQAHFRDVSMKDAVFKNVDMRGVVMSGVDIEGLVINGYEVGKLITAQDATYRTLAEFIAANRPEISP